MLGSHVIQYEVHIDVSVVGDRVIVYETISPVLA